MATNDEYKIISSKGKGLATGDAAASNESRLTGDADFRSSELERTNKVIADRQAAGADVSQQQAYLERINQLNNSQPAQEVDPYQQIRDLIVQNQQAQTASLTASQQASLRAQEANIKGTYSDAVAEQERLKTQAGENYEGQLDQIDDSRFRESERGKVIGEQRGIGNSTQFQALQQGVVSRAGKQKLEAASNRDSILSDISQRIAQLGLQKNRDLTVAQAQTDANIASGKASIANQAFGQELGIEQEKLNRANQLADVKSAQDFQSGEREATQLFQSGEAEKSRDFSAEQNLINQDFQASMQERGFEHDVTMFDKNSNLQKTMAAMQHNYNVALEDKRFNNNKAMEEYNYAINLVREANQFTPGTQEYETMQSAIEFENKQLASRAEEDFIWAKRYAEFETEQAASSYELQLDRQLKAYTPGTQEYAIQSKANEANLEAYKQQQLQDLTWSITADAYMAGLTRPGEEVSGFDNWANGVKQSWIELQNVAFVSGKSDQQVVDAAIKAGQLISTQENIDQSAIFDRMYRNNYLTDDQYQMMRDSLIIGGGGVYTGGSGEIKSGSGSGF